MAKRDMKKLAYEIADLLDSYECADGTMIYFDNKRLEHLGDEWVLKEGYSPDTYFEYCNLDTLSMSFEGPFYEVINYGLCNSLLEKFDKLIASYGYYYELGNSWNLSLYE